MHARGVKLFKPVIRQIRFRDVTFSFHIVDMRSVGIGEELVFLIRLYKKKLEPHLKTFKLPRLVRIMVWDENISAPQSSATFGGTMPLLSTPYHFSINTDNLHEEEIALESETKFQLRLMQVFLHELAHFNTLDEKEADRINLETLRKMFSEALSG